MGAETPPSTENASYYIVQVFPQPSGGGEGTGPVILRVVDGALGRDVVSQAVKKLAMDRGSAGNPKDSYVLRAAKGDGSPDARGQVVDLEAPLRTQGLSFPYMLSMCNGADSLPATEVPVKQLQSSSGHAADTVQANTISEKSPLPEFEVPSSRQDIKEYIRERQRGLEVLQARREANVQAIVAGRIERERQHLVACEKKEMRRRLEIEEKRKQADSRQQMTAEAAQRKALEDDLGRQRIREEEDRLLQEVRLRAEREAASRSAELAQFDRERELRLEKDRVARTKLEEKRKHDATSGKAGRMAASLSHIIGRLDHQVIQEAGECERMVQQEKQARARQEKELFERRYVERLERERAMAKEKDRHLRSIEERKHREAMEAIRQQSADRAAQAAKEEEAKFKEWRQKRQAHLEQEQAVREHLSLTLRKSISA